MPLPVEYRPVAQQVSTPVYSLMGNVPGNDLNVNNLWAANYAAIDLQKPPPGTAIVNTDTVISTSSDTLIDTSNAVITVTLGVPENEGQIIHVALLSRRGNLAYISCVESGGGTFMLSPSAPSRRLIYAAGAWQAVESGYSRTSPDAAFPTTQQGPRIIGSDVQPEGYSYGEVVALSADGNTMATNDGADNAVYVFVRTDETWSQQAKLTGSGGIGASYVATVTLSADGNTLAMGNIYDNGYIGATWVFVRSGSTWTQQGPKLVGTGYQNEPTQTRQGSSVSLSADGNTLAVGGQNDNDVVGATWIFVRSGTTWTQQGSKLVGTGGTNNIQVQGFALALSADGNTLAVGGPYDNTYIGAVWIFVRTGTTWAQQGSKLVASGYIGESTQGRAVALSADGNILAVGAPSDNTIGSVYIFSRTGTTWTLQNKLVSSTNDASAQGAGLALSADGYTLVCGCYGFFAPYIGKTIIYLRQGGFQWTEAPFSPLVGMPALEWDSQGVSVACSANANTIAIAAPYNDFYGGVFIFV